jgi:type IV secretion system protein VirD4
MQLPASDELVLVAGQSPIRARKLRYFEDDTFRARVVAPPVLGSDGYLDRPAPRRNDWSGQVRNTDVRLGVKRDGDESPAAPSNGGLEQARHPGSKIRRTVTPERIQPDLVDIAEEEGDVGADAHALKQARALYGVDQSLTPSHDLVRGF